MKAAASLLMLPNYNLLGTEWKGGKWKGEKNVEH